MSSHSEILLAYKNKSLAGSPERTKILHSMTGGEINGAFADLRTYDFGGSEPEKTAARRLLRETINDISALESKDEKAELYTRMLKFCLSARDEHIEIGEMWEKLQPREKWRIREDGHPVFFCEQAGREICVNLNITECKRAVHYAERYIEISGMRLRREIFAEQNREKRHALAQRSFYILGDAFIEHVLKSPERIRELIIESPSRDSIAYGHIVPRRGQVCKFE